MAFTRRRLSWPVAGTLMVEPTESESKYELDRFCDAMIAIHAEMTAVETGAADKPNNPLKNAPHTAEVVDRRRMGPSLLPRSTPPSRRRGLRDYKFWPPVGRIDNVFGDRNPLLLRRHGRLRGLRQPVGQASSLSPKPTWNPHAGK